MNNNNIPLNLETQPTQTISLSPLDEANLRDLEHVREDSEEMSLFEQSEEFSSSYAESFPLLHAEELADKERLFDTVSQISKSEDLTKILVDTGLISGINLISQNPSLLSDLGGAKLNTVQDKVNTLIKSSYDSRNIEDRLTALEDENKITLSNAFQASERVMDFIEKKNKEFVTAGITLTSVISPLLAYRMVMKLFIKGAFPNPSLSQGERLMRPKIVRTFALYSAPVIVGMLVAVGLPQKVLNINISGPEVTGQDSLKNASWFFYLIGLTKDNKILKILPN